MYAQIDTHNRFAWKGYHLNNLTYHKLQVHISTYVCVCVCIGCHYTALIYNKAGNSNRFEWFGKNHHHHEGSYTHRNACEWSTCANCIRFDWLRGALSAFLLINIYNYAQSGFRTKGSVWKIVFTIGCHSLCMHVWVCGFPSHCSVVTVFAVRRFRFVLEWKYWSGNNRLRWSRQPIRTLPGLSCAFVYANKVTGQII